MDPFTIMSIFGGAGQGIGAVGSLFGGEPDYARGAIGRDEWWNLQGPLTRWYGEAEKAASQYTPEYLNSLRKALSGQMGLGANTLNSMFSLGKQQLQPGFNEQLDAMKASFSPRLAGSGAQAQAIQALLGKQAGQLQQLAGGIQNQDAMARQQAMMQGLGQFGNFWGQNQQNRAQAMQAWNAWLR